MNTLSTRAWLPPTEKPALLAVVAILAACFCAAAVAVMIFGGNATLPDFATNLVIALALLAAAIGLWRLHRVARWSAVFLLWVVLVFDVILLLGVFNPFFAMEMRHGPGRELPTPGELALRVWPLIVAVPLVIAALHVLGKYKADFRRAPPQ